MSTYYTKKLERRTDALGNIISSADTVAAPPGWSRDSQVQLAAQALSAELGSDAAALLEQVAQLHALLPGLEGKLQRMRPAELVRLAARLEEICQQLVALRRLLPTADVAAAVAAHPPLLRTPLAEVEGALGALRQAFPDATQEDIDHIVSTNGSLLDGGESLERCLRGAGHLFTRPQLVRCLQRDPAFLFQFQPLEGQSRGERDAEYLADMWRGS